MATDPRLVILRRRAVFMGAALTVAGCSPSSPPVAPPSIVPAADDELDAGAASVEPAPTRSERPATIAVSPAPVSPGAMVSVCLSIAITPRVTFGARSAEPTDRTVLREAVAVLRDHPEIDRLALEGHRNPDEPAALSRARAARVEALMVAEGIDPNRLCLVDEGDAKPLADPRTLAGRKQNPRVGFRVLSAHDPCDDPGAER